MQRLFQSISSYCLVDTGLKERIQQDFERQEAPKAHKLLEQNRRCHKLYFIEQGVIHNYYYHDGRQVTSWFYLEDQFVTSWYSFYTQEPGFEDIECLEDCVLYAISYKKFQTLITDYPAFGNFARLLAEENLAHLDYFSKSWSFLSAKEKYDLLPTYFPGLELRVKLGHIASFLGISQETLSRIRGRK